MAKHSLGQILYRLRRERGMTQTEVCDGYCDRSSLALLENGKSYHVNLTSVMHFCQKLGVPFNEILRSGFIDFDDLFLTKTLLIISEQKEKLIPSLFKEMKTVEYDEIDRLTALLDGYVAFWNKDMINAEKHFRTLISQEKKRIFRPLDLIYASAYLELVNQSRGLSFKKEIVEDLVASLDAEVKHCHEFYPRLAMRIYHILVAYYRQTKRQKDFTRILSTLLEISKKQR